MWGLAELGGAAEGLKKILEFAETVEDRFERARITGEVQQIFVLYFSPQLTKSLLERIVERGEFDPYQLEELAHRLRETERPVRVALDRIERFGEKYQHVLTPDQRHALQMISYGKIQIRRCLVQLLAHWEGRDADAVRTLAATLLDDINQINALMNSSVSTVRTIVHNSPNIPQSGIRLSFWLVILIFMALWALVSATVIFAAPRVLELLAA